MAKQRFSAKEVEKVRRQRARENAKIWNSRVKSNEVKNVRMTFGKYANWLVSDIPDDYIKWGIMQEDRALASWFAEEWTRRYPEFK